MVRMGGAEHRIDPHPTLERVPAGAEEALAPSVLLLIQR